LALEGADWFKIRAYQRPADTIDQLTTDLGQTVKRSKDLTELPGVGKAIAGVITELVKT